MSGARQVERQKVAIDLSVRSGTRYCRTLTGQRYPDLGEREGVGRAVECIKRSLEYAEQRDVVLCLENHYKDGDWHYPEFAQMEDVFLEIVDHIRLAAFRRPVRPVQRDRRRLRSDRLPGEVKDIGW